MSASAPRAAAPTAPATTPRAAAPTPPQSAPRAAAPTPPPSAPRLVAGVGCSRGCSTEELLALIEATLPAGRLVALATVDGRGDEPCMVAAAAARGVPLLTHSPAALAAVPVPTPSAVVARHVGTPSVAEAAALLSGGRLVVEKRRSAHATCAVATWPA